MAWRIPTKFQQFFKFFATKAKKLCLPSIQIVWLVIAEGIFFLFAFLVLRRGIMSRTDLVEGRNESCGRKVSHRQDSLAKC